MRRIGVFGWGIVAPGSPNVDVFEQRLAEPGSWLTPFEGYGPSPFLVGNPSFDFKDYEPWISARFPPNRFRSLKKKMGTPTQYAVGGFIQALGQNPGIEQELTRLGARAMCIVGSGLGDIPTYQRVSLEHHRAQRRWDRFWASPSRNAVHAQWLSAGKPSLEVEAPADPESLVDSDDYDLAQERYWRFWSGRSIELQRYLEELRAIESITVEGDVERAKSLVIKKKKAAVSDLRKKWQTPEPPWNQVSADALWNIGNTPAAQISMLGKITGMTFTPYAACSSFGFSLKFGMDAIRRGEATAAVIGATEPMPNTLSVGTFYNARVLSADGETSKPLTGMRGTHVSGGSAVWIIGDLDHFLALGMKPLGMEPLSVGVSSDADHIITPSVPGPRAAIRSALEQASLSEEDVCQWDLHATGTPGDFLEVHTVRSVLPETVNISARKGTFGHGMGAGGGWELTAQYLGFARDEVYPTTLTEDELNTEIAKDHRRFVFDQPYKPETAFAGKMSMGVGGVNSCVISKAFDKK